MWVCVKIGYSKHLMVYHGRLGYRLGYLAVFRHSHPQRTRSMCCQNDGGLAGHPAMENPPAIVG